MELTASSASEVFCQVRDGLLHVAHNVFGLDPDFLETFFCARNNIVVAICHDHHLAELADCPDFWIFIHKAHGVVWYRLTHLGCGV